MWTHVSVKASGPSILRTTYQATLDDGSTAIVQQGQGNDRYVLIAGDHHVVVGFNVLEALDNATDYLERFGFIGNDSPAPTPARRGRGKDKADEDTGEGEGGGDPPAE